jgi:BirA family biotin operon repressor/biotin-[acetyl-CoA-carboxylase] ligase
MISNLFVGHNVIPLTKVDSTNNYARQLLRDKMPVDGTVIVANEQTDGRGQRENLWLSVPGLNLTCSYIFKPAFLAAKNQFLLSATVALAVLDVATEILGEGDIRIKWPNDILVDGRKIAGILIENSLRGITLDSSIVGIGLNVNQMIFEDKLNASSFKLITGIDFELDSVLNLMNVHLEKRYLQIREGRNESVLSQFNRNLFGINEERALTVNGIKEQVRIQGARPSGELQLEHSDGRNTLHQHHEIEWNLG